MKKANHASVSKVMARQNHEKGILKSRFGNNVNNHNFILIDIKIAKQECITTNV